MTTATWSLISILSLFVASRIVAGMRPDVGAVARWHNLTWTAALALLATNWIDYTPASNAAWLTLLVGILAFNFGVLFAPRLGKISESGGETGHMVGNLVTRAQLAVLSGLYLLGFAIYLRVIASNYGLGTLLTDPESIREMQLGGSYLERVPIWARLGIFLGPFLFVAFAWRPAVVRPLPRSVRWAAVVVLVLSQLALLQRTNLFLGVLWLVAVLLCAPASSGRLGVGARRIGQLAVIGVALFVAFQGLAGAMNKTSAAPTGGAVINPILTDTGTVSPYLYATSGTIAFLHLTDSENHEPIPPPSDTSLRIGDWNPQTWGRASASLPLKVVPIAEPHEPIAPFIQIGVLTNVFTWLEPFYRDFRVLGVLLGPWILGAVTGHLYSRRRTSVRAFWLGTALLAAMFHAPFVSQFTSTLFVVGILIVLLLSRAKQARVREQPGQVLEPIQPRGNPDPRKVYSQQVSKVRRRVRR